MEKVVPVDDPPAFVEKTNDATDPDEEEWEIVRCVHL